MKIASRACRVIDDCGLMIDDWSANAQKAAHDEARITMATRVFGRARLLPSHRATLIAAASATLIISAASLCADEKTTPAGSSDLPVVLSEDFESGADRWAPFDANAWKLDTGKSGQGYSQFANNKFKPPHRSPVNIALLEGNAVGDFVLECDVLQTGREYGHRDACFVFDYQDPAHFYYVHFGKQADDHANQIFIVNDAPRTKISTKSTDGTDWKDDTWHHIKVTRNAATGEIATYFDDMETPVMTATDKTFASGRIGIGTFDDTAKFDNVVLRGVASK